MENIASDLKLADLKQRDLCTAYEQLHCEASSILLFSLQWRELEEHFDSTRELISKQFLELEERERGVVLKEGRLNECSEELELKKNEMNDMVEKYDAEIRLKVKELDSAEEKLRGISRDINLREIEMDTLSIGIKEVKSRIEECGKELELKEQKLAWIVELIGEREGEVALKDKQLDDIEMSTHELSKEVESKKNELKELKVLIEKCEAEFRVKLKALDSAKERLRGFLRDIKLREGVLNTIKDVEKELERKEKVLDVVTKRVRDFELKEQKLNGTVKLTEEQSIECDLKEKHVESIKTLLQEHEEELAAKEEHYNDIQKAIRESSTLLKVKEKELEAIQNKVLFEWKDKRLDVIQKNIQLRKEELDLKQKELDSMQNKLKDLSEELLRTDTELEDSKRCIEEHSKELDVQEKQLDSTKKLTQDCHKQLIMLLENVSSIEKAIFECSKEWEMAENHLDSVQNTFDDSSNEQASVDTQHNPISVTVHKALQCLKAKQKYFNLFRKSIEECSQKLKNEESDLIRRTEELNQKNVELKSNQDEFSRRLEDFAKVKEDFASQKKLQEEQYADCRPVNSSNCFLSFHSGMTIDGKVLLFFLCEHLKVHDLVRTGMAVALQTSSHPAKLVLEAMRWFYPPNMMTSDTKFDVHNIKRGCILLSELLLKLSPQITHALKEEALELAVQWKDKMTLLAQNHLEVVAFLLLLANFGLASHFNADELHSFLNSVSHYKQAVELGQALGIADKYPVGSTRHYLVKLEQPQSLATNEESVTSFKNEQFSTNPAERRLQSLLNEQLARHDLAPSEILSTLQESEDPAKLVLDVIQGSNHQQLKEGIGFEASSLGWCRILFEKLMKISPHISPKVREDAMSLAIDWKLNIGTDSNSSLETVAFLQLLVSYGLTSSFSEDEILKLFENVKEHEQVAELWAMFGFTQKINDLVQNRSGMRQFVESVRFKYKLESFQHVPILDKYLLDAESVTIRACKKKETCQEEDEAIDAVKSTSTCIADSNFCSEEERTNKGNSEPSHGLGHLDGRNHDTSQLPYVPKMKLEQQHETSFDSQPPTNVGWQQPHPSNNEAQKMHPASQLHPIDLESQQQPAKVAVQRVHPTIVKSQQPYLSNMGTPQPHSTTSLECQQKRRTRSQTYEHNKMKRPRMSSSDPQVL